MDAVDCGKLLEQLIRIEGAKLAPYRDAAGNLIVAPDHYVKRIGVTGTGMAVLEVDIRAVAHELEASWPTVGELDAIRKRVLIHMTFNMGIRGLLALGHSSRRNADLTVGEAGTTSRQCVGCHDTDGA